MDDLNIIELGQDPCSAAYLILTIKDETALFHSSYLAPDAMKEIPANVICVGGVILNPDFVAILVIDEIPVYGASRSQLNVIALMNMRG